MDVAFYLALVPMVIASCIGLFLYWIDERKGR